MRQLFCRMGGDKLIRVDPGERVFPDALTTSVIGVWAVGNEGEIEFADLEARTVQRRTEIARDELLQRDKWPGFGRVFPKKSETHSVLGDYFRISRGQVTGCNHLWIATAETEQLIPERYLFPCVTDASEIINANGVLRDATKLRRVIDLPSDLNKLTVAERKKVDAFLELAKHSGASDSYIAKHRKPWWRVGLKPAAPIVMSYMGRRPPVFARNACQARVLNIAHAVVPLRPMSIRSQDKLVAWLNHNVCTTLGRTYGGGLVKFEPGEAMRIPIPASLIDAA